MKNELLHDYREDVIIRVLSGSRQFSDLDRRQLSDWNHKNILARTLSYELSCACQDVERYSFVCDSAFDSYCREYKNEYATADIMNGWWPCCKIIFGIDSRKDNIRKEALLKFANDNNSEKILQEIVLDNSEKKCVYKSFLRFLKVAYTIGNMTPAPINPSTGRYGLDCWEYKLERYKSMYYDKRGDVKILHFEDYEHKEIPAAKALKDSKALEKYMDSRVELILRRGYRICNNGTELEKNLMEEIIKEL